jgi:hypothetical protein
VDLLKEKSDHHFGSFYPAIAGLTDGPFYPAALSSSHRGINITSREFQYDINISRFELLYALISLSPTFDSNTLKLINK